MRRAFYALLVATLVATLSSGAQAENVSYAIVIGNNAPPVGGFSEQLRPLRYSDDDAVRYHQLFSRLGTSRLLVVLDKATQRRYPGIASTTELPSLENLRRVVATYALAMQADRDRGDKPVLYFSFSGHGARDQSGSAFLAMVDGPLTQDLLFDEVIAKLPTSYSHIIIDACHASGVVGIRGDFFDTEVEGETTAITPNDLRPLLESQKIASFPNVGVILATTLGQEAHEWSEIESGVFTHELLSGLLGPADINGDFNVEYSEVQAFVAAANRGIKDPRAIPKVIARPPTSNQNVSLVALSALENTHELKGNLGALGHFHIELENGQRYLDAHLAVGSQSTVRVPSMSGAFLRTDTHEARIPATNSVVASSLQWSKRKIAARGSIDTAYRTALFSSQFSKNYYQGYVDSIAAVGVTFPEPSSSIQLQAPSSSGNKGLAIGAASVSGVSAVAAIATAIIAVKAKDDFGNSDLQRPAQEAKQRYERYSMISIATGVTSLAAGLTAWWLWPDSTTNVLPSASADGSYSLALEILW